MSAIILSSLVNAVINGNAVESEAMVEFLGLFKAKAAKAKAKAEFETALTAAKAKADKPRKPRRSKVVEAPKPQGIVTMPSSEKLGLVQYRSGFKAYCNALIRNNGKSASAGSDSAFNEAAASLGQTGTIGARLVVLMFLHHIRTGQVISKLDLSRQGIVINHLHYAKAADFLATLKK